MGYLICNDCEGFYELLPGENQEDFEKCQCGGLLQYQEHIEYEIETLEPETYEHQTLESETLPDEAKFKISNSYYPENGLSFSKKLNSMPKILIICVLAIIAILIKLYYF